jgi:hypothetical protein
VIAEPELDRREDADDTTAEISEYCSAQVGLFPC